MNPNPFKNRSRRAARVLAGVAVALVMAETPGPAYATHGYTGEPEPPDDQSLEAVMTWKLSRYQDTDGDGRPDPARTAAEAAGNTWPVRLSACGSAGTASWAVSYTWTLNGSSVNRSTCTHTWLAPGPGSYPVSLTLRRTATGETSTTSGNVTVKDDLLIVSLGDSLGSGEGNPDVVKSASGPAVWGTNGLDANGDARCHRSTRAASAKAARHVEDADPTTSVTFVHLACSGAQITEGLLSPYAGAVPGTVPVPPQLDRLRELVGDRPVDALMLSIGVNDLNFLRIATRCVEIGACYQEQNSLYTTPIAALPGRFKMLAERLRTQFPNLGPDRILIGEYPDNTRRNGGDYCDKMLEDSNSWPFTHIDYDEAKWASNTVIRGLNSTVAQAAGTHAWTYVDNVANQFNSNGYCTDATQRRFRRYSESKDVQGDERGALHPNVAGHDVIKNRLLAFLQPVIDPNRPQRLTIEEGGAFNVSAPYGFFVNRPINYSYTVRNRNPHPVVARALIVAVRGPSNQNLDAACSSGTNVTLAPGATWRCTASGAYGARGFHRTWADWVDSSGIWHAGQLGTGWSFDLY